MSVIMTTSTRRRRRAAAFVLGAAALAGTTLASAAPASAGAEGCTAYNVYSSVDAYTVKVSYRGICNTKKAALLVTGYSQRSGYEGNLCSYYPNSSFAASYLASPFCPVWDPAGTQKITHVSFVYANGTGADDVTANSYYT